MADLYDKHKRLVMLYKLDVSIPDEYPPIYSVLFNFFTFVKNVKIKDREALNNVCYIGENNKIIFTVKKEPGAKGELVSRLIINSDYFEVTVPLDKTQKNIKDTEFEIITSVILRHLGVKFDKYSISLGSTHSMDSHFGYLRHEYSMMMAKEEAKIRNLEFPNS